MQPWLLFLAATAVTAGVKENRENLEKSCALKKHKVFSCLDKDQKNKVYCCSPEDQLHCLTGGGCGQARFCKKNPDACCRNKSPMSSCNEVKCKDGSVCLPHWGCAKTTGIGCERMFCYDFSDSRAAEKVECGRSAGCAVDAIGGCAKPGEVKFCRTDYCNGVECKRGKRWPPKTCPKVNGCKVDMDQFDICSPTPVPTTLPTPSVVPTAWNQSIIDPGIETFIDRNETTITITHVHNKTMIRQRMDGDVAVVETESIEKMEIYTFWIIPGNGTPDIRLFTSRYLPSKHHLDLL